MVPAYTDNIAGFQYDYITSTAAWQSPILQRDAPNSHRIFSLRIEG